MSKFGLIELTSLTPLGQLRPLPFLLPSNTDHSRFLSSLRPLLVHTSLFRPPLVHARSLHCCSILANNRIASSSMPPYEIPRNFPNPFSFRLAQIELTGSSPFSEDPSPSSAYLIPSSPGPIDASGSIWEPSKSTIAKSTPSLLSALDCFSDYISVAHSYL